VKQAGTHRQKKACARKSFLLGLLQNWSFATAHPDPLFYSFGLGITPTIA
jgi:hypothetical protein